MTLKTLSVVMLAGLLAACGSSPTDRTVSGAGIGAGAGAVGGALMGYNPVTGAIVGGALGAATGAVTDEDWRLRR
ncbi:MAG: YMGG-like glycine zipper-containing protein [Bdellovibrionales bacterium]